MRIHRRGRAPRKHRCSIQNVVLGPHDFELLGWAKVSLVAVVDQTVPILLDGKDFADPVMCELEERRLSWASRPHDNRSLTLDFAFNCPVTPSRNFRVTPMSSMRASVNSAQYSSIPSHHPALIDLRCASAKRIVSAPIASPTDYDCLGTHFAE